MPDDFLLRARKAGRPNTEFSTESASGALADLTLRAETMAGTGILVSFCWVYFEWVGVDRNAKAPLPASTRADWATSQNSGYSQPPPALE